MTDFLIKTINDKNTWENFLLSRPEANFLQSWQFGEFHSELNKKIFRLAVFDQEKIQAAALLVKETAKRGSYLTIAGGPLFDKSHPNANSIFKFFTDHFRKIAKEEKCAFIRLRPQLINTPENKKIFLSNNYQLAPMHLTADLTIQIDLKRSEEEILASMRKNTRYEIRKSQRIGIITKQSKNSGDIREFHEYQLLLAKQHGFVPFPYDFLLAQFRNMLVDDQVCLIHSYDKEELLASAFIIFYNNEAVYHYGISTPDNKKKPGSYACQWAAILEAKRRGCAKYNMWGIAPKEQTNHRFTGVSIFKRGFGGEEVAYLPAMDLATSPMYTLVKTFETIRKVKRKL